MSLIQVRVAITIEIDADVWAAEYGCALADVGDDVRTYVASLPYAFPVPASKVTVR